MSDLLSRMESATPVEQQKPKSRKAGRDDAPRRFGVVLFDNEKEPGAAWTAVAGQPPKRVQGVHELPTDTMWWTNMGYAPFFIDTETWRNPWLRHDKFLVIDPASVLREWGFDPATTSPDYTAELCANMFGRLMILVGKLARECDPTMSTGEVYSGNTLREGVRRLLPKAEYPKGEAAHIMKADSAYTEFTRTSVRSPKGSKFIRLMRPRISYALEMLNTPVPVGPFTYKTRAELRALSPDRVGWVRTTPLPVMAEIFIDTMNPDIAPVYAFGNLTNKERKNPRSWIAHPEFMVMSSFSQMEVRSAYVGREYKTVGIEVPEPIQRFLEDRYSNSSWCAGVLAETIWRAATMGEERSRAGSSVPPEERAQTSWRGAWLKAADKTTMFTLAMRLTDLGYPVGSYGYGWVNCMVTDDQVGELIRDGLTLGLVPRLNDIPKGMFSERDPIPWGGDRQSMAPAQLLMSWQKQMLWQLDKFPIYEPAMRGDMMKKLIESRSKTKG